MSTRYVEKECLGAIVELAGMRNIAHKYVGFFKRERHHALYVIGGLTEERAEAIKNATPHAIDWEPIVVEREIESDYRFDVFYYRKPNDYTEKSVKGNKEENINKLLLSAKRNYYDTDKKMVDYEAIISKLENYLKCVAKPAPQVYAMLGLAYCYSKKRTEAQKAIGTDYLTLYSYLTGSGIDFSVYSKAKEEAATNISMDVDRWLIHEVVPKTPIQKKQLKFCSLELVQETDKKVRAIIKEKTGVDVKEGEEGKIDLTTKGLRGTITLENVGKSMGLSEEQIDILKLSYARYAVAPGNDFLTVANRYIKSVKETGTKTSEMRALIQKTELLCKKPQGTYGPRLIFVPAGKREKGNLKTSQ